MPSVAGMKCQRGFIGEISLGIVVRSRVEPRPCFSVV